jgi:hypothetical protein
MKIEVARARGRAATIPQQNENLSGDDRNSETVKWQAKISLAAPGTQRATLKSLKLEIAA